MANRRTRADIIRSNNQTEINRRLYRAHTLAHFLQFDLRHSEYGPMPLWLPHVISYLADDICDVQQLLNKKNKS